MSFGTGVRVYHPMRGGGVTASEQFEVAGEQYQQQMVLFDDMLYPTRCIAGLLQEALNDPGPSSLTMDAICLINVIQHYPKEIQEEVLRHLSEVIDDD